MVEHQDNVPLLIAIALVFCGHSAYDPRHEKGRSDCSTAEDREVISQWVRDCVMRETPAAGGGVDPARGADFR